MTTTKTNTKTKTMTMKMANTFREHLQRAISETFEEKDGTEEERIFVADGKRTEDGRASEVDTLD